MNAETIFYLLLAAIGLAGSWLCSGLETGVYTLDRIRLRVRAGRGDLSGRILAHEISRTESLLATLLIGNAVFGYLGATGIAEILHGLGYSDWQVVLLDVAILAPVLLIFCEAFPKELFRLEADRLTYALAPVLRVLRIALTIVPAVPLVRSFARVAASWLGGQGEEALTLPGGERVAAMLRESASAGVLSATQAKLLDRALLFHRARVADEMVPWARVRTVGLEWDRARLVRVLATHAHSRFPVVDARGRVVGVVRAVDVFLRSDGEVRSLMAAPARLSPSMPAQEALARVRESGAGLGIVERDGRPVGMVAVKDLVEPLTGELA
jgi:CBS domain containing-hemolysin-like protein